MMSVLKTFIEDLGIVARADKDISKTLEEVQTLLRTTRTENPIFNSIIKQIEVTEKDGVLFIKDINLKEFVSKLAKGDIDPLLKVANASLTDSQVNHLVRFFDTTKQVRSNYENIVASLAETKVTLSDLKSQIKELKSSNGDILKQVLESTEILDSLEEPRYDTLLKRVSNKIASKLKTGTVIKLTFGAVTITSGTLWLKKALADRKGCWLLFYNETTNKTEAIKISKFTCHGNPNNETPSNISAAKNIAIQNFLGRVYNVPMVILYYTFKVADRNGVTVNQNKRFLSKLVGKPLTAANINSILTNNLQQISEAIEKGRLPQPLPDISDCLLKHPSIEGNTIPTCRLCDKFAAHDTTAFYREIDFNNNNNNKPGYVLQCEQNPTVGEVLVDLAKNTGIELADVLFNNSLVSQFKKFFGYFLLVVFILLIVWAVLKLHLFSIKNSGMENGRHDID